MRDSARSAWLIAAVLALTGLAFAGTPGSFRGTIVDAPPASSGNRWIYVQSRNGTARRVESSHARVTYDESVPAADRRDNPADALLPGTEVRVSAEQGSDGEWKASRIEILKTAGSNGPSPNRSLLLVVPQSGGAVWSAA
jgi:hypothetical protein